MPDMLADPLDHPSLSGRPADAENQPTDPSTTNAQITNQGQMGNVNIRGSQTNIGQIDTQGGAAAVGPSAAVYDYRQTIITQNQSYDVRGLPNPYLGLCNFTYAERALFAGRDAVISQTVARLTQPRAEQNLLFITGASGSGKSSLALAGLLPALEEHYAARHRRTARATFRPSERPLAGLRDALAQLGGSHGKLTNADIADPTTFRRVLAQTDYVPLLVLDQFEEFFSQSDPEERDRLFALLAALPPFAELPLHLLITMRVDYLPDLFPHKQLYEQTHHGLELRVMSEAELSEAIQRPLQVRYPAGNKRWQSELVQRLAEDASADASYLPLLQVTLETLWQGGELALVHYRNLGVAIEAHAEAALVYRDPDSKQIPRLPAEQAQIMGLFLDLVEVGSNDDSSRDVRRRRTKAELVGGDVVRARLIDELASARLLSVGQETRDGHAVEVVDIIHETLLRSWTRLHTSIGTARSRLQQRARFEESLQLWQEQKQQTDYLLVGAPLREGQALREGDDIAFRNPIARQFLATSVQQAEATRRRQVRVLGGLLALAVLAAVIALGLGFQSESRRQEATAAQATAEARRQEATTAQGAAETRRVEAVAAVTVAAQSQATAEAQGRTARARALAANASTQLDHDPELSLLLAMQAISSTHAVDEGVVAQAEDAIHQALLRSPWRVTLRGHTDDLYSAAFSPDGKLILTASADGTARLWDTATGAQKAILKGHTALVLSAVFSPDGKLILTASTDGTARLWDTATGAQKAILEGHTAPVMGAAFSPDGKLILTAGWDNTTRLWDTATGAQKAILEGHTAPVRSATFSPDGKLILTASDDRTARLWDTATGAQKATLEGHGDWVGNAVFSPDGKLILTASWDNTACLWDTATGQKQATLYGHTDDIWNAVFSPDGKLILTASKDNTAKLWDATSGKERATLRGHTDAVWKAVFSPDGNLIATASADDTARLWDTATGAQKATLRGHGDDVDSVAFSPDGKLILTASHDDTARLWDAADGSERATLYGHTDWVGCATFSPDGKLILTASGDSTARLWDAATGAQRAILRGHTAQVLGAVFSPDGKLILTASWDNTARLWDTASGLERATLRGHTDAVESALFSPDGKLILTASWDDTARLWETASGTERATLRGHTSDVRSAVFSPDGKLILTASWDNTARLWDTASGQEQATLRGHTAGVQSAAFSPDGKLIITASLDGTAKLWDAASGTERATLRGHTAGVQSAAFSPDGKLILTASLDGTAKLWEATNGAEKATLRGHTDAVWSAAFSPDGRYVVTASTDGTARQYLVHIPDLMALAQSRVSRTLTPQERATYLGEPLPAP